ncbi:PfkB family carbohydrate kinase [Nonomuraea dietziae]|uniref:PfkB family carbohydrate kinase n=1 Tax=Nonomuraea dietziae TaxID=65515 RepID=UPI0031DC54EB
MGSDLDTFPGGKGANQAVAAARLGADVALLARTGTDQYGARLVEGLAAEGVGVEHVMETEGASGVALITVDAEGDNSINRLARRQRAPHPRGRDSRRRPGERGGGGLAHAGDPARHRDGGPPAPPAGRC